MSATTACLPSTCEACVASGGCCQSPHARTLRSTHPPCRHGARGTDDEQEQVQQPHGCLTCLASRRAAAVRVDITGQHSALACPHATACSRVRLQRCSTHTTKATNCVLTCVGCVAACMMHRAGQCCCSVAPDRLSLRDDQLAQAPVLVRVVGQVAPVKRRGGERGGSKAQQAQRLGGCIGPSCKETGTL